MFADARAVGATAMTILLAGAIACSSPGDASIRPGPPDTVSVAGHQLYVQKGFTVNIFAQGVGGVRFLAVGPGGVVYATLSGSGTIVRFVDANADGTAESSVSVLTGLNDPSGIAFRGDTLYFSEETTVKRLDPGTATPVTVVAGLPGGGNHTTRTFAFGPDNLLYVAVGSSCNVCSDALPRAAVTRYNLDGSGAHSFATGLRNSVGLAFNPTTGELWANNNDRDGLGDDIPPEHVNILKDGKWYGWPQCYLPGKANADFAPGADCSAVEPPALTVQAHSAPLGLAFYTGSMFPSEYHGDAFMTYHGSWDRSTPTGAKLVRVRVQSGRPASVEDFVTGWQLGNGSRWGRPVSVVMAADGALLVSDDLGGRIWRIAYGH